LTNQVQDAFSKCLLEQTASKLPYCIKELILIWKLLFIQLFGSIGILNVV
jgi:hypothetical protein